MFERLLTIKEPLMLVSMSLPRCPNMPTNEQWKVINDFVTLLKPYESLTVQLSSEKRPALGKVIPLIRGLLLTVGNKNPATSPGNYLKKFFLETTVSTLRSQTTFSITAKASCRQYFDVEFLNIKDNPILFWKNNNLMFGALSEISLKYSYIPATYVPLERIFPKRKN
ncbi:uncharacterized protein LOC126906570 isoform X2 [Daktulosphaira vitifoliae]|uniref:uncharacterized protein LOC126906570 isoform X2 n=1 Tax=Daktulosphaira vitifoliae TaxID=58002 RepID=UPI0021A9FE06|nr:uncharacterized protein LOC126906570 isoform X2 [Daktulosphaira vitifoliae]